MEQQLWKSFIAGEKGALKELPRRIAHSWEICYQKEIDPFLTRPEKILSVSELQIVQKQKSKLIQVVEQQIRLFQDKFFLQDYLFILADEHGDILWRSGSYNVQDHANEMYFKEGTNWSETNVGTNAIGIALRTGSGEYVDLKEHYAKASRQWGCVASPIVGSEGQLLGILDISTYHNNSARDGQLLLNVIAQQVANIMIKSSLEKKQELFHYLLSHSQLQQMLICDLDFKIINLPQQYEDRLEQGKDIRKYLGPDTIYNSTEIRYEDQVVGYQIELFNNEDASKDSFYYPGVLTTDENYRQFLHKALKVSKSGLPVHIYGESGSGKEIIAKTVHYNSAVSEGPLITVNCGAVSESLLESELFGYAPGAFTGAALKGSSGKILQANHGTLFLDEVDSMSLKMQTSLLRVLEEQQVTPINGKPLRVSFHLITASNKNLRKIVADGKFREDLFYRIYVCQLEIPPLRARKTDIKQLIQAYCEEKKWQINWQKRIYDFAIRYPWYGNIREFNSFMERVHLFYLNDEPSDEQLHELVESGCVIKKELTPQIASESLVKQHIQAALKNNHYQITKTAKELGISRTTLYRKMKRYSL
ncbi:sigma-54-dependent Fis family transcriptional regulator [Liquorilactobacillus oeni]|nr:sigma 54-interacting transcriptional regulator [Liquorilactobacillus oeni]